MGFFDRFVGKNKVQGRRVREAREKELAGDLAAAVDLYQEAGLPDEAARVLLLRADAERSAEKRIALFSIASYTAVNEDLRRRARGRKALVGFDVLRERGGAFMKSEVLAVARELEECGELEPAADAYALAGDAESEVRALTAAGAIERLEERLRASESSARDQRDIELLLRRIADLDRTAERRAALELALAALAEAEASARGAPGKDDERVADTARAIRARLCRGPVVSLEIDGEERRYALGDDVTVGRGDATIVIASRAASRRHLRIMRGHREPMVEDLGTRNGTALAGARLSTPIPVGAGVELMLGGEVPCTITPSPEGLTGLPLLVDVAGDRYVVPLGELEVGGWRVACEAVRDESYVVLRTPPEAERPYLGDYQLASRVELCAGDEFSTSRGGAVRLRVPSLRATAMAHEETGIFTRPSR